MQDMQGKKNQGMWYVIWTKKITTATYIDSSDSVMSKDPFAETATEDIRILQIIAHSIKYHKIAHLRIPNHQSSRPETQLLGQAQT